MKRCEGPECDVDFEPQRSTALYHSATCRQRAARARKAAAESVEADAAKGNAEHSLVRAVRKELEEANALDTVTGQVALQLARKLADPDESGASTLAKQLLSTVAAAKAGTSLEPAAAEPAPEPVEDEVEKARRKREEARQAAGLA